MTETLKISILFLFVLFGCQPKYENQEIIVPLVKSQYKSLTTHRQLLNFLQKADSISSYVHYDVIGKLGEGHVLPLVKITSNSNISDKLDVMVIAQQHGDEPSGKEAVLELIARFANGENLNLLDSINLHVFPQINPWGGDNDQRRNANNIDLNRDHLVLNTKENKLIHQYFHKIMPEVTIDIHEYDPYYEEWTNFGYYKNADVQLGGVTNPNIDEDISGLFYNSVLPEVHKDVESKGYSFLQYTLGQIYNEDGRLRHSTVHIDDGRQSFGVLQTLSMIIEGKYGRNSIDNIKYRTESQYATIVSILSNCAKKSSEIKKTVHQARNLTASGAYSDFVGVRFKHEKNGQKLAYPLWSISRQKDTLFMVDEYFPVRVSTDSVQMPLGYLIPKNDSVLLSWLNRNKIKVESVELSDDSRVLSYKILEKQKTECFEGWDFIDLIVTQQSIAIDQSDYLYVPTNQYAAQKIVLAFEPRSMLALFNEKTFYYLLENNSYPILKTVSV
jgi:hypothetical protein